MKILLVHNFYGSSAPSGENQVFESERALLVARGHQVETFIRHSDEIRAQGAWGAAKGALATPWNPWMVRAIRRKVADVQPDVVHVHNTFPLLSPAIFSAIGNRAARVLTLHNYRLFCPAAIPMRQGTVCTECLDQRSAAPSLRYGCYRGSRLATVPLAISVALHRRLRTWSRNVEAFITLSEFQRQRMVAAGLPAEKVHVKPNFFPGHPTPTPWQNREAYVVFVGRLSDEKGVKALVQAWCAWGPGAPELRMVGDGPLRSQLEEAGKRAPIRFLGQVPATEAQAQIAGARLVILPSECFEGFPMVVREAFAFGTPAAVSDLGPLPSIVQDGKSGVIFPPSDPSALMVRVRTAWETPDLLELLGQGGRAAFETLYNEEANYRKLMDVYAEARLSQARPLGDVDG